MPDRRPVAVTVVSLLMIAAGAFGLARGFASARTVWPPERDLLWIVAIDLTGIACGVFMLRRQNWARWLTVAWLGGHVVIVSLFMPREILPHVVIFALLAYLLVFRADVRAYFRRNPAT